MVKVNVISRSKLEWTKDRAGEVPRAHRNFDPKQNPMARQVEYARAVRSAKMDRLFAKPFVGAMSGHHDTVLSIAVDPTNLSSIASGANDGELIVWDAMKQTARRHINAHRHAVEGVVYTPDGVGMLTASRDKTVKLWDTDFSTSGDDVKPLAEYLGDTTFSGIDHDWRQTQFATSGHQLEIWDINRTRPIQTHNWGDETVIAVKYNKIETHLVGACTMDRGVSVYDTRAKSGHSKVILEMSCSCLSWSPMDPNLLVAGCDDWNCYLFDLRMTGRPRSVYQGHVRPVTDIDFCPTGQSFAAGSQDCTVRKWDIDQSIKSTSTDMFHTKRMAKIASVRFCLDNNYIFTGSEDAIVRVWKSDASKPIRPFRGPEEAQFNYMRSLRDRYRSFEEVRKIVGQRNTPKAIKKMQLKKKSMQTREQVKEMSRRKSTDIKPLAKKKSVQILK
jgi:WD repeat and SOF domain-containing protein 1